MQEYKGSLMADGTSKLAGRVKNTEKGAENRVKLNYSSNFNITPASVWSNLKEVRKPPVEERDEDYQDDGSDDIWEESPYIRLLRENGAVFVNDKFLELWNKTTGLMFLYGGYGSSKTTYAITRLLVKCMENKYFRCFYGRQKKTEVVNLHSNIITEIKRNGWENLFKYSEMPTGSKEIFYVGRGGSSSNFGYGNKFVSFGCDDVESLKGIDNPTDILVDEVNQIKWEAFGMLWTRLRTPGCELQMILCFNNCDVLGGHWLKKYIFSSELDITNESSDTVQLLKSLKKTNIVKHHSVYTDNLFQNPIRYYHQLVLKAGADPTKVKAYCDGLWGVSLSAQPYYKSFNKERDVRNAKYNSSLDIHISFDENLNPYFPCLIAQMDGKECKIIDEIAAKNPQNNLRWICYEIRRRYLNKFDGKVQNFYIYGDATSKKGDVKLEAGQNLFTLALEYLKEFSPQLCVPDANPNNKMRQNFINTIFDINYDGISIIIDNSCVHVIDDLVNTEENSKKKGGGEELAGGKDKTLVMVNGKRGVQQWGHFGDCLDYLICQNFIYSYLRFQNGGVSYNVSGGGRVVNNSLEMVQERVAEESRMGKVTVRLSAVEMSKGDKEEDIMDEVPKYYRKQSRNGY